ncbi:hypothetical protein CEV34_0611 [Brucella pseudogrignonensis]|uniref:Uncharacterized protein n=1 Tax=Brucella pseudogrignonensis TaxID=419475 RepID=A0A256GS87_9HYPH|nr:hypothetical protein CEV34_0611 [Brucella pseudogrignonensis]
MVVSVVAVIFAVLCFVNSRATITETMNAYGTDKSDMRY